MNQSSYFDLSGPGERRERTTYFVLDSLLRSRIECGFESNSDRYDEDVNVYLVDVLAKLVRSPGFHSGRERDIDVFEQVREEHDPRTKSRVYRTTADHLLVCTSLFTGTPYVERDGRRDFEERARDRIGRGKAYYRWAAIFHERTPASSSAIANVLHRLSEDFERWVGVLFHMRGEYFHLYERLQERDLAALGDPVPLPALDPAIERLRDEFLDAYWIWHQHPNAANRAKLEACVKRLKGADPAFRFEPPQ